MSDYPMLISNKLHSFRNFFKLKYKELQTIIVMITGDKVIEIFCMADDFCKFFLMQ